MEPFKNLMSDSDINEDCTAWYSAIKRLLDHHAPLKTRRVKSKRLPEWFSEEILESRKQRDRNKQIGNWSEYRRYRNKTQDLIRRAKKQHFTDSVSILKDSKTIWKHLRTATKTSNPSSNTLPDELIINDQKFSNSEDIAFKLNNYFAKISELFQDNDEIPTRPDFTKLNEFINDRIPNDIRFEIPFISIAQVSEFISGLNIAKATGLDGIGPRILKMANDILAPSIAALINKSIKTATFPDKLKMAKIYPIHKGGTKCDPANYRPISILPTVSKTFEKTHK